jgi:hypothetical protein
LSEEDFYLLNFGSYKIVSNLQFFDALFGYFPTLFR